MKKLILMVFLVLFTISPAFAGETYIIFKEYIVLESNINGANGGLDKVMEDAYDIDYEIKAMEGKGYKWVQTIPVCANIFFDGLTSHYIIVFEKCK